MKLKRSYAHEESARAKGKAKGIRTRGANAKALATAEDIQQKITDFPEQQQTAS